MLLDLKGKTLAFATITLMPQDRIINGQVRFCHIQLATPEVNLSIAIPGGHDNCSTRLMAASHDKSVCDMADGSTSIATIAEMLGIQHSHVRDILLTHKPEYFRLRKQYKLKATLDKDLTVLAMSRLMGVTKACAVIGITPGSYRARVIQYKEHNLWPTL
jgi:hypothetical protein